MFSYFKHSFLECNIIKVDLESSTSAVIILISAMKLALPTLFILSFATVGGFADSASDAASDTNSISEADDSGLEVDKRIFGGQIADRDSYPFVARLSTRYLTGSSTVCSGVVLTTKIILTVAHCVKRPGGETAVSVSARLPRGGSYSFTPSEIYIHPDYDGAFSTDVAVLRKSTLSAVYMKGFGTVPIIPIQPAIIQDPVEGTQAIVVGWGKTTENTNRYTSRLIYGRVVLMSKETCDEQISVALSMQPNELVCTTNNIAGICTGDWGGPLLVQAGNNLQLCGLSMFRKGCSNGLDTPSAYFRVETVGNWLRNSFNLP